MPFHPSLDPSLLFRRNNHFCRVVFIRREGVLEGLGSPALCSWEGIHLGVFG